MKQKKASKKAAKTVKVVQASQAWQLQTAKARFSEVFRLARTEGPQLVTRQGTEAVVIIPLEQFEQFVAKDSQPASIVSFFRKSPLAEAKLDLRRDKDLGRDVRL